MSHKMVEKYDVCVVGAGTFGSCAAYHLSQKAGLRICLLGPGEPIVKDSSTRSVFGCHYDEGRITRTVSSKKTELILALQSTLGYAKLEAESGIKVFTEVGYALVGAENDFFNNAMEASISFCDTRNLPYEVLDDVAGRWEGFDPQGVEKALFVPVKGGHISIRNLVKSTQKVAIQNGVLRKEDVVKCITKEGGTYSIELENGEMIKCGKVCVTTGSFTRFFGLLPGIPDIKLMGHTVMKFEIDVETFQRCKSLPSMIFCTEIPYIYLLPPIKYPNGKYYIKLGPSVAFENPVTTELGSHQEVIDYYCQKDYPLAREYFTKKFSLLFPSINVVSTELDHCVMAITATGRQYIGFVEPGCFAAFGGNGVSAKMGLEIGRIVAESVVAGKWMGGDLEEEDFKIIYKD